LSSVTSLIVEPIGSGSVATLSTASARAPVVVEHQAVADGGPLVGGGGHVEPVRVDQLVGSQADLGGDGGHGGVLGGSLQGGQRSRRRTGAAADVG